MEKQKVPLDYTYQNKTLALPPIPTQVTTNPFHDNEKGTRFAPDTVARRNYAAATWRAVRCLSIPITPS